MKLLLDTITMGFDSDDPQDAFRRITPLVIAMGLVNLASALLTSVSRLVNQYQEQVVSDRLYEIIHDKAIAVDLEHYENPAYYDILERARNQANSVPLQLLNRLEQIGGNLVQLATMGTTLLSFNWLIGGVLVIPVIPRILVRLAFVREITLGYNAAPPPNEKPPTTIAYWSARTTPKKFGFFNWENSFPVASANYAGDSGKNGYKLLCVAPPLTFLQP